MSVETVAVVLGIMAYSIARQIAGEPLRVKRLLGLPAVLTVIGIVDVAKTRAPASETDIVLIGAGVVVNVAIGVYQGRLMRLECREGHLWGQMPPRVLWWWAAKIGSGVILDGIGHALGGGLAIASAVMLLRLGVNRLAQAAIVVPRALATGIPFAPETDKAGEAHEAEFSSLGKDLLAGIRDRTVTVLDERGDPPTRRSAPGQPRTGPAQDDQSGGYRTEPSGAFVRSVTPANSPPPSLKRQLLQLFVGEINNRIAK
ncbi:MAG TPA: hypothetical protein VMA77_31030 [Solirubrobacteraceae bacterium]|nr:hypothetical protein [Solirubrobacteraceae bacterium]